MSKVGKMRWRLLLQDGHIVADGAGGAMTEWVTVATVWGDLQALSGVKAVYELRYSKRITHRITMRYRQDPAPKIGMRFSFGARNFAILAVADVGESKRWLEVLVEEESNQ